MKEYLLDVVSALELWGEYPIMPYNRKDFAIGDYSMVVVGLVLNDRREFKVINFDRLTTLIDKGDASELGMGKTPDISLLFFMNQIVKQDAEGVFIADLLPLEGDERKEGIPPPGFCSSLDPLTGHVEWVTFLNDELATAVNIEHFLSVVLSSEFHFNTFRNVIGFSLGNIFGGHIADEVIGRLTLVHEKVINFDIPHAIH